MYTISDYFHEILINFIDMLTKKIVLMITWCTFISKFRFQFYLEIES